MQFEVVSSVNDCRNKDTIYLILDNWDDWFTYSTLFKVRYIDKSGIKHKMSGVKIGQKGQGRSPQLPPKFSTLPNDFFSLGVCEDYYDSIKDNFPEDYQREEIFCALNDIAFDLDLFDRVKELDVVQTSLMRDYTASIIRNQFHRMTMGGAWLTPYRFSYFPSGDVDVFDENVTELEFEVEHEKMPPSNIHVLIGKNGVGKTTSIAKLGYRMKNEGKKVMFIGADTFRAGAVNQLKMWAEKLGVSFYGRDDTDPATVVYEGLTKANEENIDVCLIDTAGRLQNKVNLMKELEKINKIIEKKQGTPADETLLVIDASTGQNGISQAKNFKEVTNITGIILTKLDGTAKGGIVLGVKEEIGLPVKFVGLGEKENDMIPFDIESYIYGLFKEW